MFEKGVSKIQLNNGECLNMTNSLSGNEMLSAIYKTSKKQNL